jgi:5-methylcytosine-specific restriction endonuclease McrA
MHCKDLEAKRAYQRDWYAKNREKCIEKARQRRRSPEYQHYLAASKERRKEYKRKKRLEKGCELRENLTLWTAIKKAGLPTPRDLIEAQIKEEKAKERIEYLKTPEGRQAIKYKHKQNTRRIYATSLSNRLMHKEKRQRNKFRDAGNWVEKISQKQLVNRCALFNNSCAYCGSYEGLDIQLEHVIPKSKGGPHCLANIIPACHSCNQSKRAQHMETWYKAQPFYSKERLKKIKEVLSSTPYPVKQKELPLDWLLDLSNPLA